MPHSIAALIGHAGQKREPSPIRNFWLLDRHDLPEDAGAYVLIARPGVSFDYPGGKSPVFYIGMATSLVDRLSEHLKHSKAAAHARRVPLYWPRYEYAARFGGRYATINTWQRMTPRALEEELIAGFASRFKAFPVANSAGSWNRIRKHALLRAG